jgi:hypothetical protein
MRRARKMKIKMKLDMVHVKWLLALVVAVAVSAYTSIYFTEKYVYEIALGQLSEGSMMNNRVYFTLMKDIDNRKYKEARAKLEKLVQMEVNQLADNRKRLESGYFTGINYENRAAIEKINHYLSDDGKQKK